LPVLRRAVGAKSGVMKHTRHQHEDATLEQLLQEQAAVAYCMAMDGPVYAPVLERYECEIAALLAREDAMSRARRILEGQAALTAGRDVKAIA
jgi:hypothetical protein